MERTRGKSVLATTFSVVEDFRLPAAGRVFLQRVEN
jgi:hypothetical protein